MVNVQRSKGNELCVFYSERVDGNVSVSGEACHDPKFHGVQDLHIERLRIRRFRSSELCDCLLLCVCVFDLVRSWMRFFGLLRLSAYVFGLR